MSIVRLPKLPKLCLWVLPPPAEPSGKADAEQTPDVGMLLHFPLPAAGQGGKLSPTARLDFFWMSNNPPGALTWPWSFQSRAGPKYRYLRIEPDL